MSPAIAINPTDQVGALVTQNIALAEVFERFGIDYCCGGGRPLSEVCAEKGLAVEAVIQAAQAVAEKPLTETDWTKAALAALTAHIVSTHHEYLRRVLPRLSALSSRAAAHHGPNSPHFIDVDTTFQRLYATMDAHSMKEERVLFPLIEQLEATRRPGPMTVEMPIRAMTAEHDDAGEDLRQMREFTNNYTLPAGACNTVRALYQGLQELERDLHIHIHKENHILFPRARALEAALR